MVKTNMHLDGFCLANMLYKMDLPREETMKMNSLLLALLLFSPISWAQSPSQPDQGVLVYTSLKAEVEKVGTVVSYAEMNQKGGHFSIMPIDEMTVPSRIYLFMTREKMIPQSDDQKLELTNHHFLVQNMATTFPKHPLYEDFLALSCRITEEYETEVLQEGWPKEFPQTIAATKRYLQKFPQGRYADEIEWQKLQKENFWFEFEGYAQGPVTQIKAYSAYLKTHALTRLADRIRIEIAQLYSLAASFISSEPENNKPDGFTPADAKKFKAKALEMFKELLNSKDIKARESARLELLLGEMPFDRFGWHDGWN